MAGKKLRSSLFGFKKTDVVSYICELDEKAEAKLLEKDNEISELKTKIATLQENREAIITVLQTAQANAKELVRSAREEAEEILTKADEEAKERKELVNREIEIKRRAVKNYYMNENKKIEQIRIDVERMRQNSLEAIKRFEAELRQVGRMTENSSAYINSAIQYAESGTNMETFTDVERSIPVHIVDSIKE